MKKILLLTLLILFFFPFTSNATELGNSCSTNADCSSGDCEDSDIDTDDDDYCVCQTAQNCATTYGGNASEWSCEDGTTASHKLHFCKKSDGTNIFPLTNESVIKKVDDLERKKNKTLLFNPPKLVALNKICVLESIETKEGDTASIPWIGQCVVGIYNYMLVFGTLIAVLFIVIGGIIYIVSAGNSSRASSGKKYITYSIYGLILLISSYVLLNTINPNLTNLNAIGINALSDASFEEYETQDLADASTAALPSAEKPTPICNNLQDCTALCEKPKNQWPKASPGMASPDQMTNSLNIPGAELRSGVQIPTALVLPIKDVAQRALAHPEGPFKIKIVSGYRPLSTQIQIVCNNINKGKGNKVGSAVAWPGGSLHGSGKAIDVVLMKDNQTLTTTSYKNQSNTQYTEGNRIVAELFYAAGWKRYMKEIWHFEYNGPTSCRTNTCTAATTSCTSCPS
jgi:hypothetical protein